MSTPRRRELLLAAGTLLVLWQVLAWIVQRPILPPPWQVLITFAQELPGMLGRHMLASLYRVVMSIALALATAAPLGLALGQSARLRAWSAPFIYLLYPIPKVVLVPLVLLFLGIGELPKVLIITLVLFFQVLVLSVRSLGAGRRALFRFVYLPATLPAMLTAVRQSIGTAVAVLYVAELFATRYGLGYYIYYAGSTLFDYPAMYAGLIAMSLLGFGLYALVDVVERRLCRWCRA